MARSRQALIIGINSYDDAEFRQLRAPADDVAALAGVLANPKIGRFEVKSLLDESHSAVTQAAEEFFRDAARSDFLLLAISCHGVRDDRGELHFAVTDTKLRLPRSTAVSARFLQDLMDHCRARSIVLLIDCCYSGAIGRGLKSDDAVHLDEQFAGAGRAILTASKALEYAWEGERLRGEGRPSLFTEAIVEGLTTGNADLDQDGKVSVDELYEYVHERVLSAKRGQTPQKWTFGIEDQLYIAWSVRGPGPRASLPDHIQAAIHDSLPDARTRVVDELVAIGQQADPGPAAAALRALELLSEDNAWRVAVAAAEGLSILRQSASGVPPRPRSRPEGVRPRPPVVTDYVVLRHNDVMFVSDLTGDVPAGNDTGLGLYRSDLRFLSTFELRLNGRRPVRRNHDASRGYVATFELTNPVLEPVLSGAAIPRQSLSLRRTRFVHDGVHERIALQNCNRFPIEVELELRFDADFLDIFEIRGYQPERPMGAPEPPVPPEPPVLTETGLMFGYRGRDGIRRRTDVVLQPVPPIRNGVARVHLRLGPQEAFVLLVDMLPLLGDGQPEADFQFDTALVALERGYQQWNASCTRWQTDNDLVDEGLIWRNQEDLRILCDERSTGLFPTAGVPWYSVPLGRNALVTSLQTLALNPDLAVGSLRYLARHQGTKVDHYREEEPGKILQEMRHGELANLGQVPHTPYYGTVDATPLFLVLLVELLDWTADADLLSELMPNVMAALEWIDRYGDLDGDGLVEYVQHGRMGVRNHGWKDSWDSLIEEYGEPAPLPVALVEVQGYVHQAKSGLARVFRHLGGRFGREAERLEMEAEKLRARFEDAYWMPEERFYAQALDRDKRQVTSISSNPGHCLWSGIIDRGRAEPIVRRLVAPDMFSGWGIRTLSSRALSFNPMSQHNGSVWPHDNSIIAEGMRRYGFGTEAALVCRSVLEASLGLGDIRMPEVYTGFHRTDPLSPDPLSSGPLHLMDCSPTAWGAASVFQFLRTLTGIEVRALEGRLRIDPIPTNLVRVIHVENLRAGDGELDFTVRFLDGRPRVQIDRKPSGFAQIELPS